MSIQAKLCLLSCSFAALIACDDGGSKPSAEPQPEPSVLLAELEEDEKIALCNELNAQYDTALAASKEGMCGLVAMFLQGEDSCGASYADCLKSPPVAVGKVYTPADYGTLEDDCGIPSCDVPVEEYVTCAEAENELEVAKYRITTCEEPSDADQARLLEGERQVLALCKNVFTHCNVADEE